MASSPLLLKSRALVAVGGPDWRSFLQGLLTQDIETLAPGEARFGGLLTPQGKLLHDLFVVGRDDGAWLDVAADQREALIQRLAMYRLRAKAEIAADDGIVGAILSPAHLAGVSGVIVPDPRLSALGWRTYGVPAGGDEAAYDAHRLSLGVPGPADWGVSESYPIEADFDLLNGVDFQKGCFVGQETTSRMKRRGQIRRRMLPIDFEGPAPAPGSEVLAGGTLRAGEVLSGADGRAMALVRLDRIEGADLTVDGRPVRAIRPSWFPDPPPQGEGDREAVEGVEAR